MLLCNAGKNSTSVNLVPKAFFLAWAGQEKALSAPPPSQGKGPGNEVVLLHHKTLGLEKIS